MAKKTIKGQMAAWVYALIAGTADAAEVVASLIKQFGASPAAVVGAISGVLGTIVTRKFLAEAGDDHKEARRVAAEANSDPIAEHTFPSGVDEVENGQSYQGDSSPSDVDATACISCCGLSPSQITFAAFYLTMAGFSFYLEARVTKARFEGKSELGDGFNLLEGSVLALWYLAVILPFMGFSGGYHVIQKFAGEGQADDGLPCEASLCAPLVASSPARWWVRNIGSLDHSARHVLRLGLICLDFSRYELADFESGLEWGVPAAVGMFLLSLPLYWQTRYYEGLEADINMLTYGGQRALEVDEGDEPEFSERQACWMKFAMIVCTPPLHAADDAFGPLELMRYLEWHQHAIIPVTLCFAVISGAGNLAYEVSGAVAEINSRTVGRPRRPEAQRLLPHVERSSSGGGPGSCCPAVFAGFWTRLPCHRGGQRLRQQQTGSYGATDADETGSELSPNTQQKLPQAYNWNGNGAVSR